MSSAAYRTWLSTNPTSRHLLAELQPSEQLRGWTKTGGRTYVYQVSFALVIQTSVVAGGLYRRLDSVKQNTTALTIQTSVADVDANLGSYYHDTSANVLYVSSTTGSAPSTFSAFQAYFTLFFATAAVDFSGGNFYWPYLLNSVPAVGSAMDEPIFTVKRTAGGELHLSNADKLFDQLSAKYDWVNKTVTLKVGGGTLAYADYEAVATLVMTGLSTADSEAVIGIRQAVSILELMLPNETVTETGFTEANSGETNYVPLLIGRVYGCVLVPTNDTTVYITGDGIYGGGGTGWPPTVDAVYARRDDTGVVTTLTNGVDWSYSIANRYITLLNATYYRGQGYTILADLSDTTNPDITASLAIRSILQTRLAEAIDTDSFDAAAADNTAYVGIYLPQPRSLAEIITLLEQSVMGVLSQGPTGAWFFDIWDPTTDQSVTGFLALTDESLQPNWSEQADPQSVFWKTVIKYKYRPDLDSWSESSSESAAVQYVTEQSDVLRIDTALVNAADASTLAARWAWIASTRNRRFSVSENGVSTMNCKAGDRVSVTRNRAPSLSGAWASHPMEIVSIKKKLSPALGVDLVLGNLRGTDGAARMAAADGGNDWDTATAAEREQYFFAMDDDTEQVDTADPTTYGKGGRAW